MIQEEEQSLFSIFKLAEQLVFLDTVPLSHKAQYKLVFMAISYFRSC